MDSQLGQRLLLLRDTAQRTELLYNMLPGLVCGLLAALLMPAVRSSENEGKLILACMLAGGLLLYPVAANATRATYKAARMELQDSMLAAQLMDDAELRRVFDQIKRRAPLLPLTLPVSKEAQLRFAARYWNLYRSLSNGQTSPLERWGEPARLRALCDFLLA